MCRNPWRAGRRESILQATCSVLAPAVSPAPRRSAGPVVMGGVPPAQDGCLPHARRFHLTRQCAPHPLGARLLAGRLSKNAQRTHSLGLGQLRRPSLTYNACMALAKTGTSRPVVLPSALAA